MVSRKQGIVQLIYFFLPAFCMIVISCNHFEKNKSHLTVPDSNIAKGKKLAENFCQSCHMLPDPSLLDSKSWETGVLPGMGPRLGIFNDGLVQYPSSRNDMNVSRDYYPHLPLMTMENWHYLKDYYTSVSPDSLAAQQRNVTIKNGDSLFTTASSSFRISPPTTSFVKFDTVGGQQEVMMADVFSKNIFRFNNQLQVIDSFKNISAVVDMERINNTMITTNVGVLNPNNGKYGSTHRLIINEKGKLQLDTTLRFKDLERPVQVSAADFNGDGRTDYLVCEFGNLAGELSWMENMGGDKYNQHVIRPFPGAIKAYIRDENGDGKPDIWVLFTQGEEGIFLFTNKGNGKFDQQQVLRFQPIMGSSYFELADFNKDGHMDILYTCGDNADYSPVLKPYHGIYIYLNDGNNHFTQQYFFSMYGCFKAMARDFDGDGDLDIAAISFFGDYAHTPDETFMYLENNGKLQFQPYKVTGTDAGRWLTMDAGDINGDGKTDLILGNFSIAPSSIKSSTDWKQNASFLILKNIMKK